MDCIEFDRDTDQWLLIVSPFSFPFQRSRTAIEKAKSVYGLTPCDGSTAIGHIKLERVHAQA